MSLLGIDIGQSIAKAIVFNEDGKLIASSAREYDMLFPKIGWVEIDAFGMWKSISELFREINSKVKKDPISALSVSTFGESFIPIDRNKNILYNVICPGDTRCKNEVNKVVEELGEDFIYNITGIIPSYIYSLGKILWLKNNFQEIYSKTHKFLLIEDMLFNKLGIQDTKVSYSLSSRTMFFDLKNKIWSKKILGKYEIDIKKFSIPAPSGTIIGQVSKNAKDEFGFKKDAFIVVGGHDQPCAALGSGSIQKGVAADGVGTVECITPVFDNIILNDSMKKNKFCCESHVVGNMYITVAFNMTAGSIIKWYKNTIGFLDFHNSVIQKKDFFKYVYEGLDYTPSELYAFPYFGPSATPYFYEKPLGSIMGMSIDTTTNDIFKSIIESLVFEIKFNIDLLKESGIFINELRATGGGSRSDYWLQLKSNILNIPIFKMQIDEAGCLGAVILAGVATHVFEDYAEAIKELVKTKKEFYPKKENMDMYLKKYEKYKLLFKSLAQLLSES